MENRKVSRIRTADDVLYSIDSVVMRGRMSDLSTRGCRLASAEPSDLTGRPVEIMLLQGVTVTGTVAWHRDGWIGVDLDHSLPEATVTYFGHSEKPEQESHGPTDSFGRPLPPLPGDGLFRRVAF